MDVTKLPCPICGSTNYEFGVVEHHRNSGAFTTFAHPLLFRKDGQAKPKMGLLEGLRSDRPQSVNRARHCLTCGNVQVFIETKK